MIQNQNDTKLKIKSKNDPKKRPIIKMANNQNDPKSK